jgi:hypothetical protein
MEEKVARIGSFADFWPYYLSQHEHPTNRRLHFTGTSCSLACLALGVFVSRRFLLAMPLAGYGFAWAGHLFFEKNRPATFEYPLWSLAADFRMWWRTLRSQPLR